MKRTVTAALAALVMLVALSTAQAGSIASAVQAAVAKLKKAGYTASANIAAGIIKAADKTGKHTCICGNSKITKLNMEWSKVNSSYCMGYSVKGAATAGGSAFAGVRVGVNAKAGIGGTATTTTKPAGTMVGAMAPVNGSAKITRDPPTAIVDAKAGAFAGARASATGSAGIGPISCKNVCGRAEGWAGVGVETACKAGYQDGKLKFNFGLGAALGIGGKLGSYITIDVTKIRNAATAAASKASKAAKTSAPKTQTK